MSSFNKAFLDHSLTGHLSCFLHQIKLPSKNVCLVIAGSVRDSQLVSLSHSLLSASPCHHPMRWLLSVQMASTHRCLTGPSAGQGRMVLAEGEPGKLLESSARCSMQLEGKAEVGWVGHSWTEATLSRSPHLAFSDWFSTVSRWLPSTLLFHTGWWWCGGFLLAHFLSCQYLPAPALYCNTGELSP